MLMFLAAAALLILAAGMALIFWACCKVSGDADRAEEWRRTHDNRD